MNGSLNYKRPCRLCGTPTTSLYEICLAHSNLRAALDEADGIGVGSSAMRSRDAAPRGEDVQPREGKVT